MISSVLSPTFATEGVFRFGAESFSEFTGIYNYRFSETVDCLGQLLAEAVFEKSYSWGKLPKQDLTLTSPNPKPLQNCGLAVSRLPSKCCKCVVVGEEGTYYYYCTDQPFLGSTIEDDMDLSVLPSTPYTTVHL
uniref:Uncharacterized protein n=1 Tax=Oryza sativa subsp. japonica TaxID=39947 RepID=Q75GA6_ORYSJ|nr:hypothetical protein [Oryza sativa Japonica Group]